MSTRKGDTKMKRIFQITIGPLLVFLLFAVTLQAQDSFWCGGDLTNMLDPNQVDALQAALNQAKGTIQWGLFSRGMRNSEETPLTGVVKYNPDKAWDGYTLLASMGGYVDPETGVNNPAILIDMEGNIVNAWPLTSTPSKILPGGYIIGQEGPLGVSGGQTCPLVELDWNGNKVWEWMGCPRSPGSEEMFGCHHDFQREGNPVGYYAPGMEPKATEGKTLMLSNYHPPVEQTAHISKHLLHDDALYEVDWEGNLLWEWHAWEHFDQMGFCEAARQAVYETFSGFDPNAGSDYQHFNAASYLGPNKWYDAGDLRFEPDNIIFSCRSSDILAIIARHDHPNGKWKSGDIIWRVGPDYSYGNPEYKLGQIIGQHCVHMIPEGLPGAGNILLYDNGGNAGYGPLMPGLPPMASNKLREYSRILEFDPVSLEVVWEYANPEAKYDDQGNCIEASFFSPFISSAQRLANGNTLVCQGSNGRIFELTPDKEIVWEYISPYLGPVNPDAGQFGSTNVYRAYRVPASWIPEGAG
jgi:hypothetical protein